MDQVVLGPDGSLSIALQAVPSWPNRIPNEVLDMIAENLSMSDTNNLLQTSRRFAEGLEDTIVRRDIKSKKYNSLAWACYFGDAKLAERCLANGADANAAFCRNEHAFYSTKKTSPKTPTDFDHFEIPVFPSLKLYGSPLLTGPPCSALSLATQRNHLEVMRVLLQNEENPSKRADTLEKHHKLKLSVRSRGGDEALDLYPQHSVISHVRSTAAAKILLQYGAANHINHLGKAGYTPLEMILYRCAPARNLGLAVVRSSELFDTVKLFLENGASPRRLSGAAYMPYDGKSAQIPSGPLIASAALKCPRTFDLILRSSDLSHDNFTETNSECGNIVLIALGKRLNYQDGTSVFDPSANLLELLLKAGLSPRSHTCLGNTLLSYAIEKDNLPAIVALMKSNGDVNTVHPRQMCAISEAVVTNCSPKLQSEGVDKGDLTDVLEKMLQLGADINQPSFCSEGFTPLLFAACDAIHEDLFAMLLQWGARRSGFYQAEPGRPYVSVLQSLLRGWPMMGSKKIKTILHGYDFSKLRIDLSVSRRCRGTIQARRKKKFRSLTEGTLDKTLFATKDGKHILNWAVEELQGFDLSFAVENLAPYYEATKSASISEETPLLALFGAAQREDYLSFGTLGETLKLVNKLVDSGVPVAAQFNGETVLHRICRLNPGLESRSKWTKLNTRAKDNMFEKEHELVKAIKKNRNINPYRDLSAWKVQHTDLEIFEEAYRTARLAGIVQIIQFLKDRGASLAVEDDSGRSSWQIAEMHSQLYETLDDLYPSV